MRVAFAAVALLGAGAVLPPGGVALAQAKQDGAAALSLGSANVDRLSKLVRNYYAFLDQDSLGKAKKELDKLVDEVARITKSQKLADPLLALDDWRDVVKRGLLVEKPTVNISWRADLRLATLSEDQTPIHADADAKELQGVFDNRLKAFVSVPVDFAKVAYPVILALHPMDEEVKSLKEMKKSAKIVDEVEAWAKATYSKELLAKAIVIAPVMDLALRSADQVSYLRPRWDSKEGATWAIRALSQIVFPNANHDARRLFVDGHGSGAMAALLYCAQFPGTQTGCIVRGPPPQKIDFENCAGTPILFVGEATKSFHAEWKGKEGFVLEHKDSIDDAALVQWMADHPKQFSPLRVSLRTDRVEFASSFWLRVTYEDRTKEKLPIVADAVIDREKNQVTVVTNERVKGFEIYLNDELLDLSKEVRVVHRQSGGEAESAVVERFKGVIKRVVEDTLVWAYKRPYSNVGDVYVACVSIELD